MKYLATGIIFTIFYVVCSCSSGSHCPDRSRYLADLPQANIDVDQFVDQFESLQEKNNSEALMAQLCLTTEKRIMPMVYLVAIEKLSAESLATELQEASAIYSDNLLIVETIGAINSSLTNSAETDKQLAANLDTLVGVIRRACQVLPSSGDEQRLERVLGDGGQ
jgi:hypothetical protein